MKNLLTLLLMIFAFNAYTQPPNDLCSQASPITINNCTPASFTGSTTMATASNPTIIGATCLSNTAEDVWYKFTTDFSHVDYKIVIDGGVTSANPSFAIYRGNCASFLLEAGCINNSPTNSQTAELTLLGLDANTDYYIRISTYGASALNFTGSVEYYYPPFILDAPLSGSMTTNCRGTVWDSGGNAGNYGPLENYTFTIAPADTHNAILIHLDTFDFEPQPALDRLLFYRGGVVHADSLEVVFTGLGSDSSFHILADTITIEIKTDAIVNMAGFEFDFEGITIKSVSSPFDVGVTAIAKSDTSCLVSITDTISIEIENFGTDTVSNFPVNYQVAGSTVVTETFTGTIPPNTSASYTFVQTANLINTWDADITAWTSLATDTIPLNDTSQLILNCIAIDTFGAEYISQQVVLQYDDAVTNAEIAQVQQDIISKGGNIIASVNCGDTKIDLMSLPNVLDWLGDTFIGAENQVEGLKNSNTEIKEVDLNYLIDTSAITRKPYTGQNKEQSFDKITATTQTNNSLDSVKVFILDSGENPARTDNLFYNNCPICPDLPQNIRTGYDVVNMDDNPEDDNGHGIDVTNVFTKVAAEEGFGNYKIMSIKVFDHDGNGSLWNSLLGVLIAKELNPDIVNYSGGWNRGIGSDIFEELIMEMGDSCHGLFVASAGNEYLNNDDSTHYPSDFTRVLDNVVSVAALDSNLINLATYSNYGFVAVDVAAPGAIKNNNGLVLKEGTSFAAPYVSAIAAKMLAENQHYSAFQIKNCIKSINVTVDNNNGLAVNHQLDSITVDSLTNCLTDPNLTIDSSCRTRVCIISNTISVKNQNLTFKAFPNPFSQVVNFEFDFEEPQEIYFSLFDIAGRMVNTHYEPYVNGKQPIQWHLEDLPIGVYFCHIKTAEGTGIVKIVKH